MCAKWNNNKIDLTLLANNFNEITNGKSRVFNIMDSRIADIFTVIYSSLEFDTKIPEIEKRNIVRKAMNNATTKGKLTAKTILGEVSREENFYKKLPSQKLVLVTNLSITNANKLRRIKILNNTLMFSNGLPMNFTRHSIIEDATKNLIFPDYAIPSYFYFVRIYVNAKTNHEAYLFGIDALDLLRGIWNFYLNLSTHRRWTSGIRKEVNKITLGPIHTLHKPNGNLATEEYWYNTIYTPRPMPFVMYNQYEKIRNFEMIVRKKLNKSSYKTDLINFMLKYTRALDENNLNNAFLALWSLLENLTASTGSHDDVVKRTLFLYKDYQIHKQILEHLRSYRNKTIHTDNSESEEIELLLFQLKGYVEKLIRFHLFNKIGFASIEESATFLSLTTDKDSIRKKINLLTKAEKFLK